MKIIGKKFFCAKNIIISVVLSLTVAVGSFFLVKTLTKPDFAKRPDFETLQGVNSTFKETPTDSTPADHDAKDNIYYALYAMSQLDGFKTETTGNTHAAIVDQPIKGKRYVNKNEVFKQNVSKSAFADAARIYYVKDGKYVMRNASSVSSVNNVQWKNSATHISEQTFYEKFGFLANNVSGYIFTDETILSAELLSVSNDGIYTYKYKLDPQKSTLKIGVEMATMAYMSSMPLFTRAELTISMTSDWLVTQVKTNCAYTVDLLGGQDCTESVTERFFDHGIKSEIPDASFYQSFFDDSIEDSEEKTEPTALDYIMNGFGPYITGSKPLKAEISVSDQASALSALAKLELNLNINDLSTISAKLQLEELNYGEISLSNLFFAYSDQTIFFKSGDFKTYATISQMSDLVNRLLPLFDTSSININDSISSIDPSSILSGATLTKDNGIAIVAIPIELGGFSAQVNMNFIDGETVTLQNVTASIGSTSVDVVPNDLAEIDEIGSDYNNITPIFDLIDNDGNIKVELSLGELSALVNFNVKTFALDLNFGEIKVKFIDDVVYFNYNDLKAKFAISDINSVLDKIAILSGEQVQLPDFSSELNSLNVEDIINEFLTNFSAIEENNILALSSSVQGVNISLNLNISSNAYSFHSLTVGFENVILSLNSTSKNIFIIDANSLNTYNDITSLLDIVDNDGNIKVELALGELSALVNFNVKTFALDLNFGEIKVKFIDDVVYFNYNDLKAKFAISDINSVLDKIAILSGEQVQLPDFSSELNSLDIQDIINEFLTNFSAIEENNILALSSSVQGVNISLNLNISSNAYSFHSLSATFEQVDVSINSTSKNIFIIDVESLTEYSNIATLLDILDGEEINLKVNAFDLEIDLTINLKEMSILARTELYDNTLYAKFENNKIFISYLGLNVCLNIEDINTALEKLSPVLGDMDLSLDFNTSISVEEILNSLVISNERISINAFGGEIAINLDDVNNNLYFNSLSANIKDISLVAYQSNKADYSAIANSKFYNVLPLLDLIDADGNLSFKLNTAGAVIGVTVNVSTMELHAKLNGLEAYANLNTMQAYVSYPGINAKLDLNDATYILEKLSPIINKFAPNTNLDLSGLGEGIQLDVDTLISSLSVYENSSKLNVSLPIAGVEVVLVLNTTNGELTLNAVNLDVKGTNITLNPSTQTYLTDFDESANYMNVKDLVDAFAPALENVLTADSLTATLSASITKGNTVINITNCSVELKDIYTAVKVNANLTLEVITTASDGKVTTTTHQVRLVYLDPSLVADGETNVYFTYDDKQNTDVLEGSFTTTKVDATLNILKQLYQFMPELQESLKPMLIPDANGNPELAKMNIDITSMFNSVTFANSVLSVALNGKVINSSFGNILDVLLQAVDGGIAINASKVRFGDMLMNLNLNIGMPASGTHDDSIFSYTISEKTMDFSSINELLEALKNTAVNRSFTIDAKVHLTGIKLLGYDLINITDKINIKIQIDIVDGKTYVMAKLTRSHYDALFGAVQAWKDYQGESTLYYNPDAQMIYVDHRYNPFKKSWLGTTQNKPDTETGHKEKYTIEEFMADPMTNILKIIRFSDTIESAITSASTKQKESYATADNTLTGYSYADNNFAIKLNLAPLLGDIKEVSVNIGHDDNMSLSSLNADANIIDVLTLSIRATLTGSTNNSGVANTVKQQASIFA